VTQCDAQTSIGWLSSSPNLLTPFSRAGRTWRATRGDVGHTMSFYVPGIINTHEPPVNAAVAGTIDPAMVSDTLWAASPQGLTDAVDGALMCSLADPTVQARTDCADAAVPLP
jgi:hypothetical protein